jgi:hypothetical protein
LKTYSRYITDYYNIKQLNDDIYKIIYCKLPIKRPGFEDKRNYKRPRDVHSSKLANSIARARTRVFELAICNDFDYFITLTINDEKLDRYDLGEYIKKLGQFIRDYRKKYGVNVQYLLIPEKHKDGAWHMHGLIKGIPKEHLRKNKYGYLDWEDYKKRFGYCSIDKIKNQEAVSKYITKYIRKSFDTGGGVTDKESKLYYCSRGLRRPQKKKEGTLNGYQLDKIPFNYENEYVRVGILTGQEYEQVLSILDNDIIP